MRRLAGPIVVSSRGCMLCKRFIMLSSIIAVHQRQRYNPNQQVLLHLFRISPHAGNFISANAGPKHRANRGGPSGTGMFPLYSLSNSSQ